MGILLYDALDDNLISVAGTASAQVSSATLSRSPAIVVTGVASAQVSAASLSVTGTALIHHRAPPPRLIRAQDCPMAAPPKDPSEILDYTIAYDDVLEDDEAIATSTWGLTGPDSALTMGSGPRAHTHDQGSVSLWLLGGTAGSGDYLLTNHIATTHEPPREYERSFSIAIADL